MTVTAFQNLKNRGGLSDYARTRLEKITKEKGEEEAERLTQEKECPKCKQTWVLVEFANRRSICRECANKEGAARRAKTRRVTIKKMTADEAELHNKMAIMKW